MRKISEDNNPENEALDKEQITGMEDSVEPSVAEEAVRNIFENLFTVCVDIGILHGWITEEQREKLLNDFKIKTHTVI